MRRARMAFCGCTAPSLCFRRQLPGGPAPARPADSGPRVRWLPCAHRHGVVPRGHHLSMGPLRHDVAEVRALCRSHSLPIPRGGASSTAEARHDPGPQGPQASRSVRGRGVACLLERPLSPKGAGGGALLCGPASQGEGWWALWKQFVPENKHRPLGTGPGLIWQRTDVGSPARIAAGWAAKGHGAW